MEFVIPSGGYGGQKGKMGNLGITFDSLYILIHVREI